MKELLKKIRPEALAVSGITAAALIALVSVWLRAEPDTTAAGRGAAFLSAGLFGVLAVRFLLRWMEDWSACAAPSRRIAQPVKPLMLAGVFTACLGAVVSAVMLMYVIQIMLGELGGFRKALELWGRPDSRHYISIARDWYTGEGDLSRMVELVFLPGYPLLLRLICPAGGDYLLTGMGLSAVCFAGAGVFLYLLARLETDHLGALRVLKYTCILPGALFFAAPMSESLFLLLSVSCVYCARRERWAAACVLGGLAAFTRSLGLTLLVPVGYELLTSLLREKERRGVRALWLLCLLLIPAGFGAYCAVCRAVTGDPFRFMYYQREHWDQSLGLFFSTASYQTEYAIKYWNNGSLDKLMGLWMPNLFCTLMSLAVMIPAVKRLPPSLGAYFIAYYVIAVGTTWLLSGPRYLAALFPIPMALGQLGEDRRADAVMTVILSMLYVLYDFAFAARWQVW